MFNIWMLISFLSFLLIHFLAILLDYVALRQHCKKNKCNLSAVCSIFSLSANETGDLTAIMLVVVVPGLLMWLIRWCRSSTPANETQVSNDIPPANGPAPVPERRSQVDPNNGQSSENESKMKEVLNSNSDNKSNSALNNPPPQETPVDAFDIQSNSALNNPPPQETPVGAFDIQNNFPGVTEQTERAVAPVTTAVLPDLFYAALNGTFLTVIVATMLFGKILTQMYPMSLINMRATLTQSQWRSLVTSTLRHVFNWPLERPVPTHLALHFGFSNPRPRPAMRLLLNTDPSMVTDNPWRIFNEEALLYTAGMRFGTVAEQQDNRTNLAAFFEQRSPYSYDYFESIVNGLEQETMDASNADLQVLENIPASIVLGSRLLANPRIIKFIQEYKNGSLLKKYAKAINTLSESVYIKYKLKHIYTPQEHQAYMFAVRALTQAIRLYTELKLEHEVEYAVTDLTKLDVILKKT